MSYRLFSSTANIRCFIETTKHFLRKKRIKTSLNTDDKGK